METYQIAGTYDPNYQTLAGVQGDVFGPDKKAEGGGAPGGGAAPAPAIKPGAGGMAGESRRNFGKGYIPNFVYLGTFDPNYQTLAGMNADVFGKDKKA